MAPQNSARTALSAQGQADKHQHQPPQNHLQNSPSYKRPSKCWVHQSSPKQDHPRSNNQAGSKNQNRPQDKHPNSVLVHNKCCPKAAVKIVPVTRTTKTRQPAMPQKTSGPIITIQGHERDKLWKFPNVQNRGEERENTPKIHDHHHPFYHKIYTEHLPSWPDQEGIHPIRPHTKWLSTTFYLVPSGGKS